MSATDADALDAAIGTWLTATLLTRQNEHDTVTSGDTGDSGRTALTHLRLDGRTIRGATSADGTQRHLIAALLGPPDQAVVAASAEVDGAKPRETIAVRNLVKTET
ncbi:hypothetical protein [Nonomuraea sp. KM90]|uniref:hypothetical protein n=1 Tax=Nonomuraea sp. KM90 TaxID=3457428 RepID=UPI003FCCE0DA